MGLFLAIRKTSMRYMSLLSVILFVFTNAHGLDLISENVDEQLFNLRAEAARKFRIVSEISTKASPTVADLATLAEFIHETDNPNYQATETSLAKEAREELARLAEESPSLFSQYVKENLNSLRIKPRLVGDLVYTSMAGAPGMTRELVSQGLVGEQVVQYLLRPTGFYSGLAARARVSRAELVRRRLIAQLPEKAKIARVLFEEGVISDLTIGKMVQAVGAPSVSVETKVEIVDMLGRSGGLSVRAIKTLRDLALSPDNESHLRVRAAWAIGAIGTQAGVDALWEIEGLRGRENKDVANYAKQTRSGLLKQGGFEDRRLAERLLRVLRCDWALHASE